MTLTIKRCAWVSVILLLALTFPMQVLTNNANMALLAYIPFVLICMLPNPSREKRPKLSCLNGFDIVVGLYVVLIAGNLVSAFITGEISAIDACRQIFVFVMPASFYLYISRRAEEAELKSILAGIVVAAAIIGIYFVYDSYTKMIFLQKNEYQLLAQQYSVDRMGEHNPEDVSPTRLGVQYRSMGLLESHTLSGAWIGFGAFASFFLIAARFKTTRSIVGLAWLIMLVLGLNFTSLVGFLTTVFVVYVWRGASFRDILKVRKSALRRATGLLVLAASAVFILFFQFKTFAEKLLGIVVQQLEMIFTFNVDMNNPTGSWIALTLEAARSFSKSMLSRPSSLIFGNGPVAAGGWAIGGDIGFLDTMSILGPPMFAIIIVGLFRTIRATLKDLRLNASNQSAFPRRGFLEFGLSVMLFIFIFEAHYLVWLFKSVSPILFIALGLMRRYGGRGMAHNPGGRDDGF